MLAMEEAVDPLLMTQWHQEYNTPTTPSRPSPQISTPTTIFQNSSLSKFDEDAINDRMFISNFNILYQISNF